MHVLVSICRHVHHLTFFYCYFWMCAQAQYVFIHDALNELITCGQTDIVASALRTKVNFLSKVIPAKGITGFQNQFQVWECEMGMESLE